MASVFASHPLRMVVSGYFPSLPSRSLLGLEALAISTEADFGDKSLRCILLQPPRLAFSVHA